MVFRADYCGSGCCCSAMFWLPSDPSDSFFTSEVHVAYWLKGSYAPASENTTLRNRQNPSLSINDYCHCQCRPRLGVVTLPILPIDKLLLPTGKQLFLWPISQNCLGKIFKDAPQTRTKEFPMTINLGKFCGLIKTQSGSIDHEKVKCTQQ